MHIHETRIRLLQFIYHDSLIASWIKVAAMVIISIFGLVHVHNLFSLVA